MKDTKLSVSFYWVLRIFVGVALALIVVAWLYAPAAVRGPAGPAGVPGIDGIGEKGDPGDRGKPGRDGSDGKSGERGAAGPRGSGFW